MSDIIPYRNKYGTVEINGLADGAEYHSNVDYSGMSLREVADAGGHVTRVRLLKEMGRADVSYIHATLPDGKVVNVSPVGVGNLTPMFKLKSELVAWAKREGVFAKKVGLLDSGNWSTVD